MKRIYGIMVWAAMALAAVSCGGKVNPEPKPEPKTDAPKLLSTDPENGVKDVNYESNLAVAFTYDQNIKCLTANWSKITVDNGATIVNINPYNTKLTITVGNLEASKTYTVNIAAGAVQGFKENQEAAAAATIKFSTKSAPLPPTPGPDVPEPEDTDPWKMLDKMQLGWNMGNHFDAFYNGEWAGDKMLWPDETCWGNEKCTKATFTKLYAAGFRSIRIPITWLKTINEDYSIDEKWMNRIIEVVGWARDAGLMVIINTHHDEDHYIGSEALGHRWLNIMDATTDPAVNAKVKEDIKGFWTTVANTFKNEGDYLIFESFNEINDGKWGGSANTNRQAAVLNEWNQVFVDAVRATGGNNANRWIAVPPYCAGPAYIKYFTLPSDPANHIMVAVHCYDPYNYTLAEGLPQKYWGHTMGNSWDESSLKDTFSMLYNNYVAKGIPVYMGEFGCSMRDYGTKEWRNYLYYLEYFVKCSKSYGIPCLLWDNGNAGSGAEHHAYINHGNGNYIDHSEEPVKVMVKAMTNKDKKYTLQSVYDNAPAN